VAAVEAARPGIYLTPHAYQANATGVPTTFPTAPTSVAGATSLRHPCPSANDDAVAGFPMQAVEERTHAAPGHLFHRETTKSIIACEAYTNPSSKNNSGAARRATASVPDPTPAK